MNLHIENYDNSVAVLGAGGWGIAIANLLAAKKFQVALWEYDKEVSEKLKSARTLPQKLPGIHLNPNIEITNNMAAATQNTHYIVCVVPSQYLRSALAGFKGRVLNKKPIFINLAKGIEVNTLRRMSQVIEETIHPENYSGIATLSGPSHAEEVARDMPTAIVAASSSREIAAAVQKLFSTPRFRVYASTDIIGVELAGSLKNIIALASGMLDGLGLGDNTKGALLTRGLAEITRIGKALGAEPATFSGLSGIGDLITTCLSRHSRNRFVGEQIGKGRKLSMVLEALPMVAEGVETARSGKKLAELYKIEMPITQQVYNVLFDDKPPAEAITELMTRGPRPEIWG